VFAHDTDRAGWLDALHKQLTWAPYLALPGAALWAIWVFGVYQLHVDFRLLSWAVGVPAHLLAACLYVPLLYAWYQLSRSPSHTTGTTPLG
jgi:hypothetical protein